MRFMGSRNCKSYFAVAVATSYFVWPTTGPISVTKLILASCRLSQSGYSRICHRAQRPVVCVCVCVHRIIDGMKGKCFYTLLILLAFPEGMTYKVWQKIHSESSRVPSPCRGIAPCVGESPGYTHSTVDFSGAGKDEKPPCCRLHGLDYIKSFMVYF